jgi:hypothetical protein
VDEAHTARRGKGKNVARSRLASAAGTLTSASLAHRVFTEKPGNSAA